MARLARAWGWSGQATTPAPTRRSGDRRAPRPLRAPRITNRNGDIAAAVLAIASGVDAALIAIGTRGLGGVKSLVMGSVSRAVLHHADRPVLVIPSARLTEARQHWAEHAQSAAGVA
jgi:hypothetical protein